MDSKLILTLEQQDVILMPWKIEYAQDMLLFSSNENVTSPASWKSLNDIKSAKAKIKSFEKKKGTEWAISINKERTSKIVGNIGIAEVISIKEFSKVREIGYLLAEEYWGKGIMAKAVLAVTQFCFNVLECDAISIRVDSSNKQSICVIEKNGLECIVEILSIHAQNIRIYLQDKLQFFILDNHTFNSIY